ncbi:MAG TPA: PQQ-binding-like beta-propeller repeat protein [Bdellovibrionota bacterium]|nr:PQQ-binding-like beta-propeller repeat protein [Bdellovibrionota bacterium]
MQSSSKLSSSKAALAALVLLSSAAAATGCSGRNIHPELRNDGSILERGWTLRTRTNFEAGDRGAEYSNPVLVPPNGPAEGTLVFGNQSVGLVSIYPGLNQQRWVLPIPGGVISELTVDRDSVYFGGGDGFVYSVNLDTGRVNWRYEVRNPNISRPTISQGRVLVTTSDDTVYAFDAGTGKWLWHYRRRSSPSATIMGASQPLVDGQEVLAGLSDGFLVSLSLPDGQLKWERKLHQGTKFTDVDAHPVLENGTLYVPSYDGSLYALKRQGGDVLWRFDAGGSKNVLVEDQKLYLPSSEGTIYALQKNNAKVLWKFELDRGTPTQLVSTDKYIIVGSSFQYLYVIDKATGKGLYRYNVGYDSGFSGSPAYDHEKKRLYVLSGAGNLYQFHVTSPRRQRPHGQSEPYRF